MEKEDDDLNLLDTRGSDDRLAIIDHYYSPFQEVRLSSSVQAPEFSDEEREDLLEYM